MQRLQTAISGVLGSLGIALLVVGLVLAMENTALAKGEEGNVYPCVFCTDTCTPIVGGCAGTCTGRLCPASCECKPNRGGGCQCK